MIVLFKNRGHLKNFPTNPFDPNAKIPGQDSEQDGNDSEWPSVTILIPVFNEEKTVKKTIESLLQLDYPKDKLDIMVVDDGSKDSTWSIVQEYANNPQILLHKKENGGKYTALNYGIEHSKSQFIGCLDADSFVDSKALKNIIPHFTEDQIAAVTPSMKIQNPDTILGMVQNAEYNMGILVRKLLAFLDAQYVTPGPFSIFRKSVFSEVGKYRHAHNTEDLEMALRLQEKNYKIVNAHNAVVYTVGPRTLYRLYKQRVRWTGGFIQNTIDYKKMLLNPKYGNLGLFVLPVSMYAILGSLFFLFYSIGTFIGKAIKSIERARTVGWHFEFSWSAFSTEWWLYHIQFTFFIGVAVTLLVVFSIWFGKKIAGVQDNKKMDIVYFLLIYSLISPLWLIKSVYNTVKRKDASWR